MKLALGTAQFGLDYGVANKRGRVQRDTVRAILDYAAINGIDTLDTAIAYGDSEQSLGEVSVASWRIISKLPAIPETVVDVAAWVRSSLDGSLRRLQVGSLQGLLLHRTQELHGPRGEILFQTLESLKADGLVEKIGVSIYAPEELNALWPRYRFDLVQAPYNVFDRSIETSGWLERLADSGVEVHSRSAFLQGLLLMEPADRPEKFHRWQSLWQRWDQWLEYQRISALEACLGFCFAQPLIHRIVVGVDSLAHLQEIIGYASVTATMPPDELKCLDADLINPSRWSAL